jgi:hypothetical protein
MLYGGLVQRSRDQVQRRILMREYREVATRRVDAPIARKIGTLQPQAYWATNKTVLELLNAAEPNLDFTTSELWNLIYAPALFYQDADEESARGELSFEADETPQLSEMIRMIRLGSGYLARRYHEDSPQMQQLKFLALTFQNQPDEVVREYRSIWEGHFEQPQLAAAGR